LHFKKFFKNRKAQKVRAKQKQSDKQVLLAAKKANVAIQGLVNSIPGINAKIDKISQNLRNMGEKNTPEKRRLMRRLRRLKLFTKTH